MNRAMVDKLQVASMFFAVVAGSFVFLKTTAPIFIEISRSGFPHNVPVLILSMLLSTATVLLIFGAASLIPKVGCWAGCLLPLAAFCVSLMLGRNPLAYFTVFLLSSALLLVVAAAIVRRRSLHRSKPEPPSNKPENQQLPFGLRLWHWVSMAALIMAGIFTLLSFLGSIHWIFDLLSHFRVQYFLCWTTVALFFLAFQRFKVSFGFALLAAINFTIVSPLDFKTIQNDQEARKTYRTLLLNVNTQSGSPKRVLQVINSKRPDIIILEEVSGRWIRELEPAMSHYRYQKLRPQNDNFGIALYSRHPLKRARIVQVGSAKLPSVIAEIELDGRTVTVIGTHPLPPVNRQYAYLRNDQLEKLPEITAKINTPIMLLGDFNTTPWNYHFKRLVTKTGLSSASKGYGVQPTWPAHNNFVRIPLDHCLHSQEIRVVNLVIGSDVGSDHFPVIIDFYFSAEV